MVALNYALMVISWFENLPEDERPPREIWWSEERIDEWLENVVQERGGGKKKPKTAYQESEDVPMSENEFAKGLRPQ